MSLSGHQSAAIKNDEWLTPLEVREIAITRGVEQLHGIESPASDGGAQGHGSPKA